MKKMTETKFVLSDEDFYGLATILGKAVDTNNYFATGNWKDLKNYTGFVILAIESTPGEVVQLRNGTNAVGPFAKGLFKEFVAPDFRYEIELIAFQDGCPTGFRFSYHINPVGEIRYMHKAPLSSKIYKGETEGGFEPLSYHFKDNHRVARLEETIEIFNLLQEVVKRGSLERLPRGSKLSTFFKDDDLGKSWMR